MKIALAILFAVIIASFVMNCRDDHARQEAHYQCIAWATNHVYPDGRRVIDDVDPEAWCDP